MSSQIPRSISIVALIVLGAMLAVSCGGDGEDDGTIAAVSTTIVVEDATTTAREPTSTFADEPDPGVPDQWSAILSTTIAGVTPPAAECPTGTDSNVPGSLDQARPGEGPWNNQAAVFDARAGRIVFVDENGETWTFDVCTNTWQAMGASFVGSTAVRFGEGQLVYDVDSDRTIAFGPDAVHVYEAEANTWTGREPPDGLDLSGAWPGAVYDPVSGLVLVQFADRTLLAYDVVGDSWTEIGIVVEERQVTSEGQTQTVGPPFLVGYLEAADRLVYLGFNGAPFQATGRLIDPRTGEATALDDPPGGVRGGFGSFSYATGGDRAYTNGYGLCRLEPNTSAWECVAPNAISTTPSAMVYDPINDRVVVINNFCCTWPGTLVSDDVVAIDPTTGDMVELLAAASTRRETDGS
ncbi:MAG: hypothetical protein ACR2NL_11715 [Acidimicrobiia bacterium]